MRHLSEAVSKGMTKKAYSNVDKIGSNTTIEEFDRFLEENGIKIDTSFKSIYMFHNTGKDLVSSGVAVKLSDGTLVEYYVFPRDLVNGKSNLCLWACFSTVTKDISAASVREYGSKRTGWHNDGNSTFYIACGKFNEMIGGTK